MPIVTYGIANTADDAFSMPAFGVGGDDGVVAGDYLDVKFWAAWRFLGVFSGLPGGATPTAAVIRLTEDPSSPQLGGDVGGSALGRIVGAAQANAAAIVPANISTIARGTASTPFTFAGTTTEIDVLAQLVEWMGRSGWAAGNAFALIADPTTAVAEARREFYDYGANPAQAAQLSITYTTGGDPTPTRRPPRHSYWL